MISTARRFIFLHAPKTGGNSMQLMLQAHSDDELVTQTKRESAHRFGVRGPVTPHKHATLKAYAKALDGDLDGWRIVLAARDRMARAVSYYFSPHRWGEPDGAGGTWTNPPVWDREAFLAMLPEMTTLAEFVTVDGRVRDPDHLIRQEHLAEDFAAFVHATGLPLDASALPKLNCSAAGPALRARALADPVACDAVRLRFAGDYELLRDWSQRRASGA
ncbi:MAG TPA: hypothetical protein VIJ94_09695 [Caulobacteraceae bacterium]